MSFFGSVNEAWDQNAEEIFLPFWGNSLWVNDTQIILLQGREYSGKIWEKEDGIYTLVSNTFSDSFYSSDVVIDKYWFASQVSEKTIHRVVTQDELLKFVLALDELDIDDVNISQSYFTLDDETLESLHELINDYSFDLYQEAWDNKQLCEWGWNDVDYSEDSNDYYDILDEYNAGIYEAMTYYFSGTYQQLKGMHIFESGEDPSDAFEEIKELLF